MPEAFTTLPHVLAVGGYARDRCLFVCKDGIGGERHQAILHVLVFHHLGDVNAHGRAHLRINSRWREKIIAKLGLEALDARLVGRRHVGKLGRRCRLDTASARRTPVLMCGRLAPAVTNPGFDRAADDVLHGRRRAAIGHVRAAYAGGHAQVFEREMPRRSHAGRGEVEFARLAQGKEFGKRFHIDTADVHHQRQRVDAHARGRRKVLRGVKPLRRIKVRVYGEDGVDV